MFATHHEETHSTSRLVSFGLVLAAAVILWTLFAGSAPDGNVTGTVVAHPPIEDRLTLEQRARTDMLMHATRQGLAVEAEEEFGVRTGFHPNWNLYYSEVMTADGAVTLYAAVYRRNPKVVYTAAWGHLESNPTDWQLVLR